MVVSSSPFLLYVPVIERKPVGLSLLLCRVAELFYKESIHYRLELSKETFYFKTSCQIMIVRIQQTCEKIENTGRSYGIPFSYREQLKNFQPCKRITNVVLSWDALLVT